jgi:hypothetical protein
MKKIIGLLFLLPELALAETSPSVVPPPAGAPSPGAEELIAACRQDMSHRVGIWQHNGDLACGCMFENADWDGGLAPGKLAAASVFLAAKIREGRVGIKAGDESAAPGLTVAETRKLALFAQTYPAVMFQNKKVVACFDDQCRQTAGCDVLMNDVSGTAPRR